jgi:hypothetical protein
VLRLTGIHDDKVLLLVCPDLSNACEENSRDGILGLCLDFCLFSFDLSLAYLISDNSQQIPAILRLRHSSNMARVKQPPTLAPDAQMDIPSISDDVLQCIIYPLNDDDPAVLLTQIMAFVKNLVPNHIWHRDSFELTLSKESKNALECIMRVGDSIDDEWLVVYLLWQVTKQFSVAARYSRSSFEIYMTDKLQCTGCRWPVPAHRSSRQTPCLGYSGKRREQGKYWLNTSSIPSTYVTVGLDPSRPSPYNTIIMPFQNRRWT